MKDEDKTKEQLIRELIDSSQRVAELERSETVHRQAEETLKKDQEKFQIMAEKSPLGISIIGKDGRYRYLNPKFTEVLGYTLDDIPTGGEWFKKAYPTPEYRQRVIATWFQDLKEENPGETRPQTFTVTGKNGREKIIYFRPVTMETGDQFVIYEDVTAQKTSEEALRESEERYRTVFEQSNDGIALVKGDQYIHVNQKMLEIFGYDRPEEIIGKPVTLIVHPDDQELVKDIKHRRQKGEAVPQKYEFKGQLKNGESIYIEVSATKTTYQGETVSLTLLRDVTDRKQAEETLKALSLKDDLTGLYNRRGFFALAEQGLKTAQRNGTEMLLIFGDLDNIKRINDTLGHKEGDRALMDTSLILKETFRESDIIARIGGDEFVILVMNSLEISAERLITRFEKALNDHHLQSECSYTLSMSLGIAYFDPQNPGTIDALIAQADRMMYENKKKRQIKSETS